MNKGPMRPCPHCPPGQRERKVVRYGVTSRGRQLFLCRSCGKRFGDAGALGGYSYPPEIIGTAIRLFHEGRSLRAISSSITETFSKTFSKTFSIGDAGISTQTIRRWVTEFSPALTSAWLERRPAPGLWGIVRWWSVHYWCGSSPLHWCVVMDDDSRYILAYAVRWDQRDEALNEAIAMAIERSGLSGNTAKLFFKLRFEDRSREVSGEKVEKAIDRIFAHHFDQWSRGPKLVGSTFSGGFSALTLDPLNLGPFPAGYSWIRESDTARIYLGGWVAHYNFFSPQPDLRCSTPAQVVRVDSPYSDWGDVVREESSK